MSTQRAPERAAAISLRGVGKSFGSVPVLKNIDLDIDAGQFCVIVGPSGCGKSTLLRLIAGLDTVTSGAVTIDGRRANEVPPSARGVAMVFQSYALYPHMTVYENIAFGLRLRGVRRQEVDERVMSAANLLELGALLDRLPKQLSGGQRQRVAIGRAISRQPRIALLDEPLSNLDAALRSQMRVELASLHERLGMTIVHVTHDQIEAMTLAGRIVLMNDGEIVQVGAPLELYRRPQTLFAARFLGSPQMNLVPGRIGAIGSDGIEVTWGAGCKARVRARAAGLALGDAVTLGIRPEHLELRADESALRAQIVRIEDVGDHSIVHLELAGGGGSLIAKTADRAVCKGQMVPCVLPAGSCHAFDGKGQALGLL
jgi:ABC-type sugar transport system ATPase subunit